MTNSKLSSKLKDIKKKTDTERDNKNFVNAVAEMLERKGISPSDVGRINKVSFYQQVTKDEAGDVVVHDLQAIQLSPSWEEGPEWPVIQPGPKIQLQKSKTKVSRPKGWEEAVIVPDIQIGFYKKSIDGNELEPIHDEKAIAVALKVIEDIQPNQIVLVGDNLDFAEFGKYLTSKPFQQMLQPAIDRATMLCAQLRSAAPNAKIHWIAGNHEARMAKYIQTNAMASFGLTNGKLPEESRAKWPVMSVPAICRMDEFDINYVPGYPESYIALNENLMVIHGHKVTSNGSTTTKYLNDAHVSVIYGHIHRTEYAYRTRLSKNGPRTVMAASPGCLCRIDGAVPSTKSGADEFGRPMLMGAENWQQGLAVVQYQPTGVGNEWFNYEPMWIYNGRGFLRGKEYSA
ncbi:MAG: metallophosphoesterase [Bacteroidota bacterium]